MISTKELKVGDKVQKSFNGKIWTVYKVNSVLVRLIDSEGNRDLLSMKKEVIKL